ncbi:MAG: hypothetical protein ACPG5B_04400 [Chitinophagales bacterium]
MIVIKNVRIIDTLNANKPFRHFKHEVDYQEDVRQNWFAYRNPAQIGHITKKME